MARIKFKQAPHYRTSKKGKRFKAGRGLKKVKVRRFRRPTKSTMSKYKGLSYNQIKKKHPIHPLRDDDGDKKRNYEDCRPWNKKLQDGWAVEDNYIDWNTGDERVRNRKEFSKKEEAEKEFFEREKKGAEHGDFRKLVPIPSSSFINELTSELKSMNFRYTKPKEITPKMVKLNLEHHEVDSSTDEGKKQARDLFKNMLD